VTHPPKEGSTVLSSGLELSQSGSTRLGRDHYIALVRKDLTGLTSAPGKPAHKRRELFLKKIYVTDLE